MTNLEKYKFLGMKLAAERANREARWEASEKEEDDILDDMDAVWDLLTEEEQAQIRRPKDG